MRAFLRALVAIAMMTVTAPLAFAFHVPPWDTGHQSMDPDDPDQDTDPEGNPPNECGSPVEVANGNFVHSLRGLLLNGYGPGIDISLTYNSRDMRHGWFGVGWLLRYDQRIIETTDSVNFYAICAEANGSRETYTRNPNGSYTAPPYVLTTLTKQGDGTWTLREKNGSFRRFNADGRLFAIVDRNGNTLSLTYDAVGFLTAITDASGRSVQFAKGANGLVQGYTDPAGNTYHFAYDAAGNLTSYRDALGNETRYGYDAKSNLTTMIDARGNQQMRVSYDALNRVASHVDGAETWTYTYQPSIQRTTKRDSSNNAWIYDYNDSGSIVQARDPLGNVDRYVYDANLRVTRFTNKGGRSVDTTYDAAGNPLTVRDANGTVKTISYDAAFNRPVAVTDGTNNVTTFGYDTRGNLVSIRNAAGQTTSFVYDARGQLMQMADAAGQVSRYQYDQYGNLVGTADPLGAVRTATFDVLSKVLSATDNTGRVTTFAYDGGERLTKVSNPQFGVTNYEYDATNNTTAIVFASGSRMSFSFDAFNRLSAIRNANNQATTYAYDRHNNITQRSDARGQTVAYQYDALDRVTRKTKPAEVTQYTYDAMDNMLSAVNPNASLSFAYDALNRLVSTTTGGLAPATTLTFAYDADGNRTSMSDPLGTTTYAYDALARLVSMRNPAGQEFSWSYDSSSRRTRLDRSNGLTTTYVYDAASRLLSLLHQGGPTALAFAYSYDAADNRLTMTDNSGVHAFTYDGLNRLAAASHPLLAAERYTYDSIGNRLQSQLSNTYLYDSANRLQSDDTYSYVWDAAGNMVRKTVKADGRFTSYTYDAENRLTRIDFSGGRFATYRYDGLGRRIEKNVDGTITKYVHDGSDILLEYNNNVLSRRYTHGPAADEVLAATTAAGQNLSFQTDALGSVTRVLDDGGNVVASYVYDTFGRIVERTGVSQGPFAFQGREFDDESGLYYFRARYYDPQVGRFVSEDPLGAESAANFYAFVHDNPVNLTDPLGLEVGFWESLIPVWGSGKQAYEDFSCGRWGWGLVNTALAVSDVFLVKAIATGVAKGVFKSGLRMGMSRSNPAFPRGIEWVERSHWIPKRWLPESLKDAGWNMKLMWGSEHALADPYRYRFLPRWWKAQNPMPGALSQQWNRIPDWVKGAGAAGAYGAGRATNASRNADCGCK